MARTFQKPKPPMGTWVFSHGRVVCGRRVQLIRRNDGEEKKTTQPSIKVVSHRCSGEVAYFNPGGGSRRRKSIASPDCASTDAEVSKLVHINHLMDPEIHVGLSAH